MWPARTFGYADYKNVIKWNLKNALICLVFADPVTKLQLRILKALEVTALQSNSNRKIDLYSKHRENKLQALPKTDLAYKWSEVGTRILHHHVCHELRNGLLDKLFLLLSCIATKSKSMKKYRSRTTASTSREQTTITYNSLCTAKIFELGQIRWYPGFNCWLLSSPRPRRVKKWTIFFQNTQLFTQLMYFNALYWKICIALLCLVFADPVTYNKLNKVQ